MEIRKEILNKPNVYSWGTKVDFVINSTGGFSDYDAEKVSLLSKFPYVIELEQRGIHPNLESGGSKGYRITLNATDTACNAEVLGTQIAYSLLNIAINRLWGMSLSWPDSPLPCRVIDRTASRGATTSAFLTSTSKINTEEFVTALDDGIEHYAQVPYRLLLSMELCASSRLESNNRSKLILLISSFEALTTQKDLTNDIGGVIDQLVVSMQDTDIPNSLKESLRGQLSNLKKESIRKALLRFLQEAEIGDGDLKFVDEAYQARSKIVHEGMRIPELDKITSKLDFLLIDIYKRRSLFEIGQRNL